jgi:hypothetical protein
MKSKHLATIILLLISTSCIRKDIAKNLRPAYKDGSKIGVQNIKFQELEEMKKGEACAYNILYFIPVGGSDSVMAATQAGKINQVKFIGQSGFITFPYSKTCTVVYGD